MNVLISTILDFSQFILLKHMNFIPVENPIRQICVGLKRSDNHAEYYTLHPLSVLIESHLVIGAELSFYFHITYILKFQ